MHSCPGPSQGAGAALDVVGKQLTAIGQQPSRAALHGIARAWPSPRLYLFPQRPTPVSSQVGEPQFEEWESGGEKKSNLLLTITRTAHKWRDPACAPLSMEPSVESADVRLIRSGQETPPKCVQRRRASTSGRPRVE